MTIENSPKRRIPPVGIKSGLTGFLNGIGKINYPVLIFTQDFTRDYIPL